MSATGLQQRVAIEDLGLIDYVKALSLQRELVERRRMEAIPDTLLLMEHPPTITLGRNASEEDILVDRDRLMQAGITIRRVERGGGVTCHNPGQLVGWPIMNLRRRQRGLKQFIAAIEEVFIRMLMEDFSLPATRDEDHRGVWIGRDKIVALGFAITRGVTMHGFALNVANDLGIFDWIIPCGIEDRGQTSISRLLGREVTLNEVKPKVADWFRMVFERSDALNMNPEVRYER